MAESRVLSFSLLGEGARAKWQLLLCLAWSNFLLHLGTQGINSLAPIVVAHLSTTAAGWGGLVAASSAGAALGSMPGGWLGDRLPLRLLLVCGAVALATFFGIAAVTSEYGWFLLAMAGSGVVTGLSLPAVNRAVIGAFGVSERGLAMGLKQSLVSFFGAGSAAALALIAVKVSLAAALGGLAGLIVASGTLSAISLGRLLAKDARAQVRGSSRGRLHATVRNQLALATATFFMGAAYTTFTGYLVLYLHDSVGMSLISASIALSFAHLAGAAGRLGWGGISDLAFGGRRRSVLVGIALLTAASALALSGVGLVLPIWLSLALAATVGFAVFGWYGVALTALGEAGGSSQMATSIGRGLTLGFLGQSTGPVVFGFLVDMSGSYAVGWTMLSGWAGAAAVLVVLLRED